MYHVRIRVRQQIKPQVEVDKIVRMYVKIGAEVCNKWSSLVCEQEQLKRQ